MLRKYKSSRTLQDNINLGSIAAFAAGMVNVSAFILFFAFTSNITGYYAILADEIAEGKNIQVLIVLAWIALFFMGSFLSNFIIIHGQKRYRFLYHAIPLGVEMFLLLFVWYYGDFHYEETLAETEFLIALLLFAMGIQNGLTATLSNFAVKTTHLTGLTTDLAINISMLTHPQHRSNPEIFNKIKLYLSIASSYLLGGLIAGFITHWFEFKVFPIIALVIGFIIVYDYTQLRVLNNAKKNTRNNQKLQLLKNRAAEIPLVKKQVDNT